MVMLGMFARGAAVVILPAWDTRTFLQTIERERITTTMVVPTMLNLLMDHPSVTDVNLSSLRCIGVGAAPVSPQRLRDAVKVFGPIVIQGYGLGETTSVVTVLTAEDVVRGIESDPELLLSCGRRHTTPMFAWSTTTAYRSRPHDRRDRSQWPGLCPRILPRTRAVG